MSQGVPTGLEGQIESPNPFEVFWDKNKRLVIGLCIAVVAAIAVKYGLEYQDRKAMNAKWSAFSKIAGLSHAYLQLPAAPDPTPLAQRIFRLQQLGQVTDLEKGIEKVPLADIEGRLEEVRGDRVEEPLTLWVLAIRHLIDDDFDSAKARLEELRAGFPTHFLCKETPFPVQYRKEIEDPDRDPDKPVRPQDVKFEPPVAGSSVGQLLDGIAAEAAFRAANRQFFDAPEPESTKAVEIVFGGQFAGKVKIRFFENAAPKHVRAFLGLVEEGFFNNMRVHYVERAGFEAELMDPSRIPGELKFGLEVTKEDNDRANWTATQQADQEIDWEDTGLSHFPGMVAAEQTPGKAKSQIERIVINSKDVAGIRDGTRVIFGRVVEGLDLIQEIVRDAEFQSESDDQSGFGAPADDVRIESVTIVE
ncbi:MAG: peptidylprolyl isomerase [Planctomycetes bacterium]|nr:peptidylprolyl isomerase [Planctomycetota bacterium]